jgi:hypothetical protein
MVALLIILHRPGIPRKSAGAGAMPVAPSGRAPRLILSSFPVDSTSPSTASGGTWTHHAREDPIGPTTADTIHLPGALST